MFFRSNFGYFVRGLLWYGAKITNQGLICINLFSLQLSKLYLVRNDGRSSYGMIICKSFVMGTWKNASFRSVRLANRIWTFQRLLMFSFVTLSTRSIVPAARQSVSFNNVPQQADACNYRHTFSNDLPNLAGLIPHPRLCPSPRSPNTRPSDPEKLPSPPVVFSFDSSSFDESRRPGSRREDERRRPLRSLLPLIILAYFSLVASDAIINHACHALYIPAI